VAQAADSDCFNWGYDPVHYNAPEGSYASDANDGAARVREFRAMVQGLHETGLRVTMDVVYNHTSQSQQGPLSCWTASCRPITTGWARTATS
jgi:pullulanase